MTWGFPVFSAYRNLDLDFFRRMSKMGLCLFPEVPCSGKLGRFDGVESRSGGTVPGTRGSECPGSWWSGTQALEVRFLELGAPSLVFPGFISDQILHIFMENLVFFFVFLMENLVTILQL